MVNHEYLIYNKTATLNLKKLKTFYFHVVLVASNSQNDSNEFLKFSERNLWAFSSYRILGKWILPSFR